MNNANQEFIEKLRATFAVEAQEHLQAMTTGLLELEKSTAPEDRARLVETIFRAAHSLKGAARAVDFSEIESQCQALEDVFSVWKKNATAPSTAALDTVHRTLNAVTNALATPAATRKPAMPHPAAEPQTPKTSGADIPAPILPRAGPEETVRIAVSKLDARLLEAEEFLAAKLTSAQRATELRDLAEQLDAWHKEWAAIWPETRVLRQMLDRQVPEGHGGQRIAQRLSRLLDFMDWNLDHLKAVENRVATMTRTAEHDRYTIGKLVDDLMEDSKQFLLLPFSTLTASFPKLVRDLCREQGKEADLVIRGEDVELDKRILEEMKDPLTHLLRNCVDHGVETPEQRTKRGKSPRATIILAAARVNGDKVEFLVSDDGAGIDVENVKKAAVQRGVVPADKMEQLDDNEARMLIFRSDVSTSRIITRLSGRGLGLAIVREKAEKLGGKVTLESQSGHGTSLRISVPTMLATFRGILVEVEGRPFVVPATHAERVVRVRAEDIKTVEGRETLSVGGHALSFVRMAEVLEVPASTEADESGIVTALILGNGQHRIAFAVDKVLDEQEVLVKPLRPPLARIRNFAGATVLGSGQVAPVFNVPDLLNSARKAAGAPVRRPAATPTSTRTESKSLLVVEDSITSRMLLKSILESAGFTVKTAVDGMEAFTMLRAEPFDLVVSDVEMPRLNGFDLTARIRADRKLAELPVILVTALETREDRERGIDVGANAYLVKSRFDQSDLVETVKRLI